MAKTESTAINSLIELQANATPLPPAPGEDLMFAEPTKKPPKPVSNARMSSTLTNAAPVEPLPRGRGAAGTQQNSVNQPGVRVTSAQPSRSMTIPPMAPPPVPTKSAAGITPPLPTSARAARAPSPSPSPSPTRSSGTVPPPLPTRSSGGIVPPPLAASSAGIVPPPVPAKSSAGLTPPFITSAAGIVPPPSAGTESPRSSRPGLPPPRPSAAMVAAVSGAPLLTPPPTDPSFDPAPIAPIDLTDQSWFEDSRAVDKVSPVSESTWVGTVQVPKPATTAQWLGKLAMPMGAMVVVGIFVGGYVAFDGQGGHKRTPVAASAATASANGANELGTSPVAASETGANAGAANETAASAAGANETGANAAGANAAGTNETGTMPTASAAGANAGGASAAPDTGTGALPGANGAAASGSQGANGTGVNSSPSGTAAVAAVATPSNDQAAPAITPPNLAAASAVAAATSPVAKGKSALVDVRLDSQPSGATVMLVDRGKTMFLGTTPISTALDPARQYDVVFTYKDRPTVLEHVDPRTQSKVMVTLHHGKGYAPTTETAKAVAPKAEAPKAEAPKAIAKAAAPKTETPKAETPKAEPAAKAPKAEAPKAVAKEAPKAETPKAGGEGVLMVSSKPPCEIYIDGKATGLMTPQRSLPLPAGTHKVTLINATEKIKKTLTVQITADQPTKLIQDLMAK